MKIRRPVASALALTFAFSQSSLAHACGVNEEWLHGASDVVFEGRANCEPEERKCRVRVGRVLKTPEGYALERRQITVDYYNWYDEEYPLLVNENTILMVCGMPVFEPDEHRFRALFFANIDEQSQEMVIRRYRIRSQGSE